MVENKMGMEEIYRRMKEDPVFLKKMMEAAIRAHRIGR